MSNDNSAYFTGTLSYPMIAFLMLINKIPYDPNLLPCLQGIFWKKFNQKYKNNYDQVIKELLNDLKQKGQNIEFIKSAIQKIYEFVCALELSQLGPKKFPPKEKRKI